jgi:hypothetical protein
MTARTGQRGRRERRERWFEVLAGRDGMFEAEVSSLWTDPLRSAAR